MFNIHKFVRTLQEEAGAGEGEGGTGGDNGSGGVLLAGKYKTQGELVQGYTELQTSFSGKDEAHQVELSGYKSPEEYTAGEGWGNENPMHNRMMSVLQEVGKEHSINQGTYEAIFNGITEMESRVAEDNLGEVMKSIPNYDNRANAMQDTALRFLRPDQAQAIDSLMQTKESFEAVELLMGQVRGMGLPTMTNQAGGQESEAELRTAIRKLNPADTTERKRLTDILNSKGDGEGKLI